MGLNFNDSNVVISSARLWILTPRSKRLSTSQLTTHIHNTLQPHL